MLADFLDKNDIRILNEPIAPDQIDQLKTSLSQDIDDKQNQLHQFYHSKLQDITRIDEQTEKLISQCEQLESKRKELIERIDDYSKLENHARHVNSNYHQVHRLNQFIDGLKQLIRIQTLIQECRRLCRDGRLSDAKAAFHTIESLLTDEYLFPTSQDKAYQQHNPLYETFQRSTRQLRSDISQLHHTLWKDGVDDTQKNQLTLNFKYIDELFQSVLYEDRGERVLTEKNVQAFATYCLQRFIQVLVEKRMGLTIDAEATMVSIQLENADDDVERGDIEQLDQAFQHLQSFLETLNTHLLSRAMKVQASNEQTTESIPLMSIFSATIANESVELLREHLLNVIPSDFQDSDAFRALLQTVKQLEQYLLEVKFVAKSSASNILSSVVGNMEEAIVKSRCRAYLIQSRQLLQSNANLSTSFKTMVVGDNEQLFQASLQEKERYKVQAASNLLSSTISLDELDANMFRFPQTTIVEHVHEYMAFLRTILHEADQLENYGAHLCATARNMMELFHVVYGNLHEKKAQEFPYLTALHFNTYMYVAHECLLLGEEYYHLKSKTGDGQPITFVDYVAVFRNQAACLLKSQLDTQRDLLTSFIKEVGAFHNIVEETHTQDLLKRAVSKCTMQLENLSHKWRDVFAPPVYFKVLGYLCDHVSQLLIKETLSLEDIPEQECEIMVGAFTQWSTFLQNILVKDEISPGLNILARLAPNLTRFNELCLVLSSSMQTIVDRWFNGQGPLASQFTAIEVKQLIRALFQTSERRTAALAKIQ